MTNILFKVHPPTSPVDDWVSQELAWPHIARGVIVQDAFDSLTVKALYLAGLIYDLSLAVNILLSSDNPVPITFYPAYGVFASTIELLGRCIRGIPRIVAIVMI